MNKPGRHHYLPRVQIEHFKKNGQWLIYDKKNGSHFTKKDSRDLFEVRDSNVTLDNNGELDYSSEEEYFHNTFESRFNEHYCNLVEFVESKSNINSSNFALAINFFLEYAIIGYHRALRVQPTCKESHKEVEKDVLDVISRFKWIFKFFNIGNQLSINKQLAAYKERRVLEESRLKIPIQNLKDISQILPSNYKVYIYLADKEYFYLPDSCSIVFRNPNAKHIYNDQISKVLVPLSSRISLEFWAYESESEFQIVENGDDYVRCINEEFMKHCFRWIIK